MQHLAKEYEFDLGSSKKKKKRSFFTSKEEEEIDNFFLQQLHSSGAFSSLPNSQQDSVAHQPATPHCTQDEKITSSVDLRTEESFSQQRQHAIRWEKIAEFMRSNPDVCKAHESLSVLELLELISKFYHFDKLFTLRKANKERVLLEDNTKGFFQNLFSVQFNELSKDLKLTLIDSLIP